MRPQIVAFHAPAARVAHRLPQRRIRSQALHRRSDAVDGLLATMHRDLDTRIVRNLYRRTARIEAEDWPPCGHAFEADQAAGFMEARVDQNIALPELGERRIVVQLAEELDAIGDAEGCRELFQPSQLGAVADHPIFAVRNRSPCEGLDAEVEAFPMQHSAHADETAPAAALLHRPLDVVEVALHDPDGRIDLHVQRTEPAHPLGAFARRGE